jgi:GWxTD domain-containing protein
MTAIMACGGVQLGTRPVTATPPQRDEPVPRAATTLDATAFVRQKGLLAQGAPVPFIGSVAFAASPTPDSTHAIVSLALSADALTFKRESDEYRADYRVTLHLRRDATTIAHADATEPVRVATLRETSRGDESILFQQLLTAPPGLYTLTVEVRDIGGGRAATYSAGLRVPSYASASLTAPTIVYEVIPRASRAALPRVVVNARSAAIAGRDSTFTVYTEAYGENRDHRVTLALRVEDQTVWTQTVTPTASADVATSVVFLPLSVIGVGSGEMLAWRADGADTTRTPVFVGFGDEIPVTTYADMLSYLQHFTSASRLRALVETPPAERGAAWADFNRATDPAPGTPENEALRSYLSRMRRANAEFQESGVEGWRTDRGMVFLALGEPDAVLDQFTADAAQRGRTQQWEYRAQNLSVVFVDATGFGRWRLTRQSEAAVAAEAARRHGGPLNPMY